MSLKSNLLFILLGYMITYGHGMHSVCVMVEEKGESSVSPSMVAYVDFLHEFVSHNMFVGGIYAMIILIMKAEKDCFVQKTTEKQTGATRNGHIATSNGSLRNCTPNGISLSSKIATTENLSKVGASSHSNVSALQDFLLQWTWPVILGVYFSIFAGMTGTVPITILFYAFIYTYTIILDSCGGIPTRAVVDSELFVWATVVKAACVGLPTLGLWLWVHR